ncbi:MAG: methionyl-tRNA formyltransferase [Armatimonadetes bacterium]|jgi:methionyl-tRNA formyltransferase|nr:methionyl-tRNA formyltransferase [Armatimonadota bacterium]
MKVVFAGTSEFAVPALEALIGSEHEVVGVITQPDKPKGRGRELNMSPVKLVALANSIPVIQPEKIRLPQSIADVKANYGAIDAMVVAAYGQIVPQELLDWPALGCINVHGSILPKYRGAAPVHYALICGEKQTGITTMMMDAGLDTGDILLQSVLDIDPEENTGELMGRLARLGADVLLRTLSGIADGAIAPIPQDNNLATSAPSLKRDAGAIDWSRPAAVIVNLIRGCTPRPGAFSRLDGSQVKVFKATLSDGSGEPGQILSADNNGIVVAAGEGSVRLLEVQPESRKRMSAADFARGGVKVGRRFDVRIN